VPLVLVLGTCRLHLENHLLLLLHFLVLLELLKLLEL
jgi:hypothetical protein